MMFRIVAIFFLLFSNQLLAAHILHRVKCATATALIVGAMCLRNDAKKEVKLSDKISREVEIAVKESLRLHGIAHAYTIPILLYPKFYIDEKPGFHDGLCLSQEDHDELELELDEGEDAPEILDLITIKMLRDHRHYIDHDHQNYLNSMVGIPVAVEAAYWALSHALHDLLSMQPPQTLRSTCFRASIHTAALPVKIVACFLVHTHYMRMLEEKADRYACDHGKIKEIKSLYNFALEEQSERRQNWPDQGCACDWAILKQCERHMVPKFCSPEIVQEYLPAPKNEPEKIGSAE